MSSWRVDPIDEYTEIEDSRGVMVPVIPEQRPEVVERWVEVVERLMADDDHWTEVAEGSHAAACAQRDADAAGPTLVDAVDAVLGAAAG